MAFMLVICERVDNQMSAKDSLDLDSQQRKDWETIKLLADYLRQMFMLQVVSSLLEALRERKFRFSDLLGALSDYTALERAKDPEPNSSWDIISSLLKVAAEHASRTSLSVGATDDDQKMELARLINENTRKVVLLSILPHIVTELQEQKYRFSDLLKALSDCAAAQRDKDSDSNAGWEATATLLKQASEEAERQGREIP